ncbi:hypothetical protein D3C71_1604730 [compost metagenome]
MLLIEGMEDDDFVNPVQELRTEALLKLFHNLALHITVFCSSILHSCESKCRILLDRLCAYVRSQNN